MKTNEFLDVFREKVSLPPEVDIDAVCNYLQGKFQEETELDPVVFSESFMLSFEALKYINELETKKHLEDILGSLGDVFDNPDYLVKPAGNTRVEESEAEGTDENCSALNSEDTVTLSQGIWQKILSREGGKKILGITAFFVCAVLCLPVIALVAVLCGLLYVVPLTLAALITIVFLAVILLIAVLAVISLSYGIANLFSSVPIGLMEIGIGTVLFAIATALWALNLQLFVSLFPFLCKKITSLLKKVFERPFSFIFGKGGKTA